MKEIIVDCQIPTRLDRYLRRHLPQLTQGMIEKALRRGDIKINDSSAKVSSNVRVSNGNTILLYTGLLSKALEPDQSLVNYSPAVISLAKKLRDDYLLCLAPEFWAINKPAGLAVQGGSKIRISVDEALAYLNQQMSKQYKLVHRLDKETSGVLLIADGLESCVRLGEAFRNHHIKKTYLAKVSGCPSKENGFLANYIGKDRSGTFERVKEQQVGGKLAETYFQILSSDGRSTLLELSPKTGRMHQLRFHCQFLQCPIIGDAKYGGIPHQRLMLHAAAIQIDQTVFDRVIDIQAPLPTADQELFFHHKKKR